jgi:Ribonuclease G/E
MMPPTMHQLAVTKLFHEIAPGQTKLGFFGKDNRLLDVWFDPLHHPNLIGSVHNIRIERVFPDQNRATGRLDDGVQVSVRLRKADAALANAGAILQVTITAAPRHGKPWQAITGARLASHCMILLVGLPKGADVTGLSSRIPVEQRAALKARLATEAVAELSTGFGVILRRNGVDLPDFASEVSRLIGMWQTGANDLPKNQTGIVFDGGGLLARAKRLVGDVMVLDDPVREPQMSCLLDDAIAAAISPKTLLASGGHLWCEQSHALWSIDLDSAGVKDFDRLFDEAANEIARQIRLRAMSGPVLIDVPRMAIPKGKRFRKTLQDALANDPRQPDFLGMTRGGLLELQIAHGEMALDAVMQDQPAQDALAGLRLVSAQPAFQPVKLAVSRAMAIWLEGPGRPALDQLDRQLQLVVWSNDKHNQTAHILG